MDSDEIYKIIDGEISVALSKNNKEVVEALKRVKANIYTKENRKVWTFNENNKTCLLNSFK